HLAVAGVGSVTPSGRYVGDAPAVPIRTSDPRWTQTDDGLVLTGGGHEGPGAIVVEGLPTGRLTAIRASGAAVGEPQGLAVRTLDPLPGEELCRLATLSDLHLGTHVFGQRGTIRELPTPEVAHPQRCTEAALAEADAWGAERIVVKGDLTNQGAAAHWREFARLMAASPVPVDALPGNHDHAHPRGQASIAPAAAAVTFGLSIADPVLVRDLAGVRLILIDSTRPGMHGGTVDRVLADVAAIVADADRAGGVIIALHHQLQPHRLPEGWPSGIPRDESFRFLERIGAAHPHVLVTSGHTHRHRRWGHAGVAVTQVGSTKDYPGVWAGYVVHEGGMRQVVRRVARPDCLAWTDHSRRAAAGLWRHVAPGRLDARCFNVPWTTSPF
ncbi:MAG TPA: metallophosphoesterase, partial [Acidimicrobiales bacterium]